MARKVVLAMTHDEAMAIASGYAWASEDVSGILTAVAVDAPGRIPSFAFAEAFAAGWDDFNAARRYCMTNVRDAYETWQASEGRTIFRDELQSPEPEPRHMVVPDDVDPATWE